MIYNVVLSKLNSCTCLDPHFIAALIGLLNTSSVLIVPNKSVPRPVAAFSINPKANSSGSKIITDNTLNISWCVAAEKARLNSFPLLMCPIDTIVFVTVVPMFAPIIIGIAPDNVSAPVLTIPTIREVVVDELWNNVVANIPTKRAIKGLLVVVIIWFAKSPPNSLIPLESPLIPTKNR